MSKRQRLYQLCLRHPVRLVLVMVATGCLSVVVFGVLFRQYTTGVVEQLLRDGRTAFSQRDNSKSIECAEHALRLSPDAPPAWKLLAEATGHAGQNDRSLEALDRYAQFKPTDAGKLCLRMAIFWMKQNRTQPAIQALQLAERLNVNATEAISLQEQIAAVTGHTRETVRCIIELLKRDAFTRGDMLLVTAMTPSLGDIERRDAIIKADPSNKAPLMSTALSEIALNHVNSAESLLTEIIAAHPEDFEAIGLLGELYAVMLPEKFLEWHRQLPESLNDDPRIWSARGKWLAHIGQTAPAIRCLHESLLREPEQLPTTAQLGQLLKSHGDTELGNAFTERGARLQRVVDLNRRLFEPRAIEFYLPMITELEATGRLWEAWGWCMVYERTERSRSAEIQACKVRLQAKLNVDLPRTVPGSLPGGDIQWERYPLPDWNRLSIPDSLTPNRASEGYSGIRFEDQSATVGLDVRYVNSYAPETGRKIFETMGAGVAVADFDADGWPDLYFPQGNTSVNDTSHGPSDQLFRNQHGIRYNDVTSPAGISEPFYSQGVAAGDFNNDGFQDFYVANLGRNRLYRNNGDGTFDDATESAGLNQNAWTVSCAIADLNGDGMPELFDVNYAEGEDLLTRTCLDASGRMMVCRPTVFDSAMDTVAENLGDGRFQEHQSEAGLDLPQGMGLGLVIADFSKDERPDVFIANDMTANYLLINEQTEADQKLRFRDEAFLKGVALDQFGFAQACMGVACADVNRDGLPDLFATNFAQEANTLYLSQPGGDYQDQTQSAGLREPSFDQLGFGTQFLDADNDGWYDLAVMNGHIDEFVNEPYRMKAQFFRGLPDGRFAELFAPEAGTLFDKLRLGRGMALLDWNRDGLVDFVATDLEDAALLAENHTKTDHRSLRLQLIGTESSRDAIGAKVRVTVSSGQERFAQITAGDGYESSNERLITLGCGPIDQVDQVEITWPSGQVSTADRVQLDQAWLLIEGQTKWHPRP